MSRNRYLLGALALGLSAALAGADLAQYRDFRLGAKLPITLRQAGSTKAIVRTLASRPALIQEFDWTPPVGSEGAAVYRPAAGRGDSVRQVTFQFYNGELYRIAVGYDASQIEGLTDQDLIQLISSRYGPALGGPVPAALADSSAVQPVARWEDPRYSIQLVRAAYDAGFGLVLTARQTTGLAEAALIEAERLDIADAPQREKAESARQAAARQQLDEKARTANRKIFRP